ncbi:3-keto-steroid reductase [Ceratocystis pirilliformis]|uniref:3-keto-steroid reductase n=1 Tax=Ceratocystis pirilliformis TaxID=259994 RepID=A0ABR3YXV6_9PEZI
MSAPWDSVSLQDLLVVLVTGANSGIGLGIGQKLLDDFLTQRSSSSHLILIPTTRSPSKSRETVTTLRAYLTVAAKNFAAKSSATDPETSAKIIDSVRQRVHIVSVQLDLCDLKNVYHAAQTLVSGRVSNPPSINGTPDALTDVRIPKLDSVIFNAGFGGWTGIEWVKMIKCVWREGILASCTWPDYKAASPGDVITQRRATGEIIDEPKLGTVFCSNVFGHYTFGHQLVPLLSRGNSGETPGRIIWTSSIEPQAESLSFNDIQGVTSLAPYESSKRLTDLLAITNTLPSVSPMADSYFTDDRAGSNMHQKAKPTMYVTHPGVVASPLFPLKSWMFHLYRLTMYLCRIFGSPWHPVEAYAGATAAVWLVLSSQKSLDQVQAQQTKWGTAASPTGRTYVKPTEVDGWGWNSKSLTAEEVQKEIAEPNLMRMAVGRHPQATDATKESRMKTEEEGARIWREMEDLRVKWEAILDL